MIQFPGVVPILVPPSWFPHGSPMVPPWFRSPPLPLSHAQDPGLYPLPDPRPWYPRWPSQPRCGPPAQGQRKKDLLVPWPGWIMASWNFLETFLKLSWNFLETFLNHLDMCWSTITISCNVQNPGKASGQYCTSVAINVAGNVGSSWLAHWPHLHKALGTYALGWLVRTTSQ